MRFFGRGQDNRGTGSYPSSSHAARHVMHWHKRKQLMQKAHWIHGLGTAAWIWQGFCLSLCLEPCHTSASSSGLTGKICGRAGEPGDIWLILLWFFQNCCCISHLRVYFIDLYVMETSAASGGLPSGLGSFGAGGRATASPRETSQVLQVFSLSFFLPFISYWFSKGRQNSVLGKQTKRSINLSKM